MINWRKMLGLRWWCGRRTIVEGYPFFCTGRVRGHSGEHIADDPDNIELLRWSEDGGYRWMG
jgi:hypothetical protein